MYTILLKVLRFQVYHVIQQHKAANIVCFTTRFIIQELKENSYLLKTRKLLEIQQTQNLKLDFLEAIVTLRTELHATVIKDRIVISLGICVLMTPI